MEIQDIKKLSFTVARYVDLVFESVSQIQKKVEKRG